MIYSLVCCATRALCNFFGGVSLWDNKLVNECEGLADEKVQNAQYSLSYSLEEARNNSSLNLEGSLGLDLKLLSAHGSAEYLNDSKSTTHEVRIDVACTIVRRTRRILQETLALVKYQNHLDNPRYTHFVAEVVEGGSAALTFAKSCSSSEEVKKITGKMRVTIVKIPILATAEIQFSDEERRLLESVKISYSGAMAEIVVNLEDALRVARDMPIKLARQLNTLSYKLLPLSVLDSKIHRMTRRLDDDLINETAKALRAGADVALKLNELGEQNEFKEQFSSIRAQILNFSDAFSITKTKFTEAARQILPELRDGNSDKEEKIKELREATTLFQNRISIAEKYIEAKEEESSALRTTVVDLLAKGFEDQLGGYKSRSMLDGEGPRLLLSFGGSSIGRRKHPLQTALVEGSSALGNSVEDGKNEDDDTDDEEEEEEEEWFENQNTFSTVRDACAQLLEQRSLAIHNVPVIFGVASIHKAHHPGKKTKSSTSIGDIILDDKGKLSIVTRILAKAPKPPYLNVDDQSITVTWIQERASRDQSVIPTTGFMLRYRRQPNAEKDGAFPRATDNEPFTEILCGASETSRVLSSLTADCDYAVAINVQTNVGPSDWSSTVVKRTAKIPSIAPEILDFFDENESHLTNLASNPVATPGDMPIVKPWDLHRQPTGKKDSLFLGTTEVVQRPITDGRFQGEIALRIVDVAPQFKPKIKAADVGDHDKTVVVVFTGASGHGKSTQINAFISYLFGGDPEDGARILVIDDRGAQQHGSVTQIVTCFRIRPLAPAFRGKTLLIVDTPDFGDSRGIERDAFVTAAMSEFFNTVNHVNAVIFTVRANEVRTTFLSPVSTYIFSLFAKDIRGCLRTTYTFSDPGSPLARGALQALRWPVENGEVFVNNSAFNLQLDGSQYDASIRESWIYSVRGQYTIMKMLFQTTPVSTKGSSEVTRIRMSLEKRCEFAEKNILRTANEAQNLITRLNALSDAIGKPPDQKVWVKNDVAVEKPIADGLFTTLCLDCNYTCHEICGIGDDNHKISCVAMERGSCTACKGKCKWNRHRNARFIITRKTQVTYVVPAELIKTWNEANNTHEGALLGAMDRYLQLQESLRTEIIKLAELSEKLSETALLHDPSELINYMETLYKTAKAQGTSSDHLSHLATTINTLILVRVLKGKGKTATRDSSILLDVIGAVRVEMERRTKLSPYDRAAEEKPCSLYNRLRERLPVDVKKKAPAALRDEVLGGLWSKGDRYAANLKAVIRLIQLALKDGGVIAALSSRSGV